ncbi:scopoletin glucosyltransferase-like [Macadamia integrifolia]|uniref:scopoletin glucosyltransferase-like n=1 Tax=Macadamia integrifolia TaxID=60698 RepID=UPI001C4F8D14|nr:scopoletin glucosyltransferase-like [Macadamia integrifolia]
MGSEPHQLHAFFFPLMAQGHLLPIIDMARLFASRGIKVTIITTPLNAPLFSNTIERDNQLGLDISVQLIPFPSEEVGLPQGCENLSSLDNFSDMAPKFFKALDLLQKPLEELLQTHSPHCLVADMFFPWATDIAAKLGIPRLIFHGTSFFSLCLLDYLRRYPPHENIETFTVVGLPDQIELRRYQLPDLSKTSSELANLLQRARESEEKTYGVLVNSFYELEPGYADYYRNVIGRKAWHIGPVSLRNRDIVDKAQRGNKASIVNHACLSWLDSKKPNSVLYLSFGSVASFTASQLFEIAIGLESSGYSFIWVVKSNDEIEQRWMSDGFEERIKGRGLLIRDWAPQVLILDHPAVGGFMTHCGWNSTLESVSAGVPMITWPLFAEQFYNEKLVTQVLRVGVSAGVNEWSGFVGGEKAIVKREDIEKAVEQLMGGGEEAERMRTRAMELKEMARRAVEEGGSSYNDLTALIEEIKLHPRPAV